MYARIVKDPALLAQRHPVLRVRCWPRRNRRRSTDRGTALSTTETARPHRAYALGHTPQEYERLRAQARVWEVATGRLFDQVGLPRGASCLDAGCGPGETMRVMAERVGPEAACSASTRTPRSAPWRWRCCTAPATGSAPSAPRPHRRPDPFPARRSTSCTRGCCCSTCRSAPTVLARLWDAVAPGGHLLVQDYDLRNVSVLPDLDWGEELCRVIIGAFAAAGRRRVGWCPAPAAVRAGGRRRARRHRRRRPHRAARHRPRHHGGHLAQLAADGAGTRRHHRAPARRRCWPRSSAMPPGSPTIRCSGRC